MHYKHLLTALAVLSSFASAAPAQDTKAADKGGQKQYKNQNKDRENKNNNGNKGQKQNKGNGNRNGDVTIIQNINRPNIIIVQENLDKLDQLQRENERELAALVQSQLALATQLQTVKDTIRINHFKAQFPQANTIIVTVTGLVDNRNQGQQNKRYLVNQLLADNGQPGKQALVMVTDPIPMQISTKQAATSQSNAFGAARVALAPPFGSRSNNTDDNFKASAVSGPDAVDSTLRLASFDQTAPFGQIGQSIILPAGTQAPQLSLSVPDPAAIILPNQQGLFVENSATFLSDCASSAANAASGNPALAGAASAIFSSFQQIAAAQLAGLSGLGIFNNTGQAQVGQPLGAIAVGANQGQPPPAAVQPPAQVATPPQANTGQPLGAIAAGANQGQSPPAQLVAPPQANGGQPLGAIAAGANQGQPSIQPAQGAAAPQPPAAIVAGANQAQPAAASPPPQGSTGTGIVIIGSNPGGPGANIGGQSAGQAAAGAPAPVPPAAIIAGANQGQPAPPQ
ncbi:uncharacterized protein CTRU02_213553 [Colletotrichum truncatum]|uniref:Uncharacterized protein n=1 Tax=Colletotrichum truncatum TaxID=5467 RepID=A0ACC3YG20_COLTU